MQAATAAMIDSSLKKIKTMINFKNCKSCKNLFKNRPLDKQFDLEKRRAVPSE
jgi:hypothetical protein